MSEAARRLEGFNWADYRSWPDDERWEIVGGRAYAMSPSPGANHQAVQLALGLQLGAFLKGRRCRLFTAPFDVKLSDQDVVQPDLLVVCDRNQIKSSHMEGAPTLVVEILSNSTALLDRTAKMELYARAGVKEVWLATPWPSLVEVYRLDGKTYRLVKAYKKDDVLRSPRFPKLRVNLAEVFDLPVPPEKGQEQLVVREPPPAYASRRSRH